VDRLFEVSICLSKGNYLYITSDKLYVFEDWVADCPYHETHEADEIIRHIKLIASHVVPYPLFESRIVAELTIAGALNRGQHRNKTLEWKSTGYVDILPDNPSSFEWFWPGPQRTSEIY